MKIHNVIPIVNNNSNLPKANKNVAFSGTFKSAKKFFQLGRHGNMTRRLFVTNALIFMLGGRLINSRDNNERRETLTRDIPTIGIAVYGVPVIKKWAAKQVQKYTGFGIIDPEKEIASSGQLQDWYKYDEKLASGFDGFSKRLIACNGNLKKIFSSLGDEMKTKLINFSEDNTKLMDELSKNVDLKQSLQKAFSNTQGNKALEQVKFLKTIPTIIGFIITLATIGILIPELNISITERLNKKKKA